MKKLLKSQRGLSLPMVLMVLVILTLFSTVIISLGTTDTLHASKQSQKLEAYYLARSGAEAVASYFVNNPDNLNNTDFKNKIDAIVASGESTEFKLSPTDRGTIKVKVEREGDNLLITATASLDGLQETVSLRVDKENSTSIDFDKAVYALENIDIKSRVKGNIAALGSIKGSNGGTIVDGEIFIRPGAPSSTVSGFSPTLVKQLTEVYEFPEFPFPDFPDRPNLSDLSLSSASPTEIINTNTHFRNGIYATNASKPLKIYVGNDDRIISTTELKIGNGGILTNVRTGSGDLYIFADDFKLESYTSKLSLDIGDGDVNIITKKALFAARIDITRSASAKGKLNIYVEDMITFGSGFINENGDPNAVNIYFAGSKDYYGNDVVNSRYVDIGNAVKMSGLIHVKQARLNIAGGGSFKGNIISCGKDVLLNNGSFTDVKFVYAPNATVHISAQVKGVVISKNFVIDNGGYLEYARPDNIDFLSSVIGRLRYKYGIWK
jgi:cytoskeletal protein CcmA (bactofilin family)